MDDVVRAEGNRQILLEPLPERNIEFCIILLQEVNEEEIFKNTEVLSQQSYDNWTVVYPMKDIGSVNREKISEKIRLLQSTGNKGHNIEQAVTKPMLFFSTRESG